jgi:hypothetical protein
MIELKDFLGKEFEKDRRVIYKDKYSLSRGIVIAVNKDAHIKVENEITKETIVIKNTKQDVYAYTEDFDMNELFEGFNIVEKEHTLTNRDFIRQLSEIKDLAGDRVLDGDKVILLYNDELILGRTTEINKKTNVIYVSINSEKYPVSVKVSDNMYLVTKDYYIKSK